MATKIIALALVMLALFAGIYIADQAGWIDLQPGDPPRADSLFQVQFLTTSSIDRTEQMESIDSTGHVITYAMNDNDMDGLGDINLDTRVTNVNIGGADETWAFGASIDFVDFRITGGQPIYILNQTDLNTRWDVAYSLGETGSPTLSQVGDRAESRDWKTGMSDQLNIDLRMNPTATALFALPDEGSIEFTVGGVKLTVVLRDAA